MRKFCFIAMTALVALAVIAPAQQAHAYTLLPYKMNSQIWYQAFSGFGATSKMDFRVSMSQWNAYLPEYRRVCYDQTNHNQASIVHGDGQSRIYKTYDSNRANLGKNHARYSGGILLESDININSAHNWFNGIQSGCYDVESVILHEVGHTVGLNHSINASAIMYPNLSPGVEKLGLRSDDINGINARYA